MDIRELHNEAMYKAELGDIQKYQGNLGVRRFPPAQTGLRE